MQPEKPKYHGQEERDAIALAIGKIVMAWNEFHETLAGIYAEICGRDKWQETLKAWHSIPNDRRQRMKLLEAAKAKLTGRSLEEIIWLVETTDTFIANQRNIGVHMPLMSFTDQTGVHQMLPDTLFGNRRAMSMLGRDDLLGQYEHFRSQIAKMSSCATSIAYNISPVRQGAESWHERPTLTAWDGGSG
jgi:hypothetical protein